MQTRSKFRYSQYEDAHDLHISCSISDGVLVDTVTFSHLLVVETQHVHPVFRMPRHRLILIPLRFLAPVVQYKCAVGIFLRNTNQVSFRAKTGPERSPTIRLSCATLETYVGSVK